METLRTIRLMKLALRDFKGFTFTLEPFGENISLFGTNATRKTTIEDAFTWLLFGKNSLGESDFEIKNLNPDGSVEHNMEHSVEGVLDINGDTTTLKKVYHEVYTKKRGQATDTFTGHTVDHYINGVPKNKGDYEAKIAEIAGDEEIFRLLTSPTAFANMPDKKGVPGWKRRRALLFDICGTLTDADVIASDEKLAPLPVILGKNTVDEHKAIIGARRTVINKELSGLPIRIDEVRRGLPDLTGLDHRQVVEEEVKRLETAVGSAKLKLQGIDTGGAIAGLSKTLAGIDSDLSRMETAHFTQIMGSVNRLNQQMTEVADMITANRRKLGTIDSDIKGKTIRLQDAVKERESWIAKWQEVDAQVFQDTTESKCVTCGHALAAELVQSAREKALATFNQQKADRLEGITKSGHQSASERDRLQGEIDALSKEREIIEAGMPALAEKLQQVTAERDQARKQSEDYTLIPGHAALVAKKADITQKITAERNGHTQDSDAIKAEVKDMESALSVAKANADKFVRREQGEKRIEELKVSEKLLAAEFEKLESELFLCDLFVRTKVGLLTERINSRFEYARFRLFRDQVNGGLDETCDITYLWKPPSNGQGINAGADICRTLQRHYGIHPVVFFDNAEAVVELLPMECQVIRLMVSAEDKVLRVEHAREMVAA